MARGSSSRSAPAGRSKPAPISRAGPPPASRAPPAPAPSHTPAAPAQSSQGGGMLAGLGATVAQGFAFGAGSAVAHQAVGAMFGGGSSRAPAPAPVQAPPVDTQSSMAGGSCDVDRRAFMQCLQQNSGNVQSCDFYYNALQQCQSSQI